ncbi:MAG: hypothetical protein DRN21_04660 [Thermoplasmata archaeon]|nr:MAG: hypothetical protein DRN07_07325 [Thermoplasmata archaeon]RLF38723.1 MAG: hypothetical protein DRN21_04660 [Thermoplasmata archaeon]
MLQHIIKANPKAERRIYHAFIGIELMNMKHAVFMAVLCSGMICSCGCLERGTQAGTVMTMNEFLQDYTESRDNTTKTFVYELKSLDDGDTLIIRDTLFNLSFNGEKNYTLVLFSSVENQAFAVEGDITGSYEKNDAVELTFHIIKVNFQFQGWNITYETFKEGWDTNSNNTVPFPQTVIRHA